MDEAAVDRTLKCDCHGWETPTYLAWEREGKVYCEVGFAERLKTPHGKAYEAWFVQD